MKGLAKKIVCILLVISIVAVNFSVSFAKSVAGQELRTQVLYIAGIIDNDFDMTNPLTRKEFARMLVKASEYKDAVSDNDMTTSFEDVPVESIYSSFIKIACREGYMTSYLGGKFKPDELVTYKDAIRSALSLLGYENNDFTGNQINGRYSTFCSLKMDTNIEKNLNDAITKVDAVNILYNALKTYKKGTNNYYGPSVFQKMSVNSDGELNASGLIKTKLEGPFILKKGENLRANIPFDTIGANIFINGVGGSESEINRELSNKGFLVYYYNETTRTIYIYKEGNTMDSSTLVKKGYVNHIYYSASDILVPTKVEIDLAYYNLANTEVRFAFSYTGTLQVGDQVVFIYTKASNNNSDDEYDSFDDGNVAVDGSITFACLYDVRY